MKILKSDEELVRLRADPVTAKRLYGYFQGVGILTNRMLRDCVMNLGGWHGLPGEYEFWRNVHTYYAKTVANELPSREERSCALDLRVTFFHYFCEDEVLSPFIGIEKDDEDDE